MVLSSEPSFAHAVRIPYLNDTLIYFQGLPYLRQTVSFDFFKCPGDSVISFFLKTDFLNVGKKNGCRKKKENAGEKPVF